MSLKRTMSMERTMGLQRTMGPVCSLMSQIGPLAGEDGRENTVKRTQITLT